MSAGRFCSTEVDVITPGETAQTAAGRMHSRKVGTLVVVDEGNRPIGILTDRDVAVRVVAEARDSTGTLVSEIMTPHPDTVREDASLEDALRLMRAGPFRRVPVVDEKGRLIGLLSLDDVLRVLAQEFAEISRLVEQEAPSSLAEG